jgi:DNA-binding response OmpR family regulator
MESMNEKQRVLVIGSSLTSNGMRQFFLEDAGYCVITALGLAAALKLAKESAFDLAVVDGLLPPEDIRELLPALRSLAIRSLLVALPDGSPEVELLADVHIPAPDALTLLRFVYSLLHATTPGRRENVRPDRLAAADKPEKS